VDMQLACLRSELQALAHCDWNPLVVAATMQHSLANGRLLAAVAAAYVLG